MMGTRKHTGTLFDVGNVFPFQLRPGSFHAQLAQAAPELFKDEAFQALYDPTRGRYGTPPSLLALLIVLQTQADCSDEEAIERTACELRWCAVLGKQAGPPLCVKSTLQRFRAQLVLKEKDCVLKMSLDAAKRAGLLGGGELRIFIDTKPILGWGAVKDTYNLLGDGIALLVRALAREAQQEVEVWAGGHRLLQYFSGRESSLKGGADLDWTQARVRREFLSEIVGDALRVCELAATWLAAQPTQGSETEQKRRRAVEEPYAVLQQIIGQDVTVQPGSDGKVTAAIKEGTASDRICSTTDPEQRHGHKSKSKKFNGHKLRISVTRRRQVKLVVGVDVLAGNAADAEEALAHVEQVEANTGLEVTATGGDCAFGSGATRQEFAAAGRELLAKSPEPAGNGELYPKGAFQIDLEAGTVTCPAGKVSHDFTQSTAGGSKVFRFGTACDDCPLRAECTKAKAGRTIQVHPQESLLAAARAFQQTAEGKAALRERVAVEHVLGQMAHVGAGQARYEGRAKTRFQMGAIAAVVNLRQIWNWEAKHGPQPDGGPRGNGDDSGNGPTGPAGAVERSAKGATEAPMGGVGGAKARIGGQEGTSGGGLRDLICWWWQKRHFRPGWCNAALAV